MKERTNEQKIERWKKTRRNTERLLVLWLAATVLLVLLMVIGSATGRPLNSEASPFVGGVIAFLSAGAGFGFWIGLVFFIVQARRRGALRKASITVAPEQRSWRKTAARAALFLGAAGAIVYLFLVVADDVVAEKCKTKECFVAAATECRSAKFTAEEQFAAMRYDIHTPMPIGEDGHNCVFVKTVARFNADERPEIRDALEGKSLTCDYTNRDFDERWLGNVVFGIEQCEGELREAIGQILLAL